MDLEREEAPERLFDREAVLGRDARSVFPTEIAKRAAEERSAAADAIGGRNFITESELEAIRVERGEAPAEPVEADKPLAVVLAEAKQAKEDAFQAQWKQMKTGKNRPLDEDELEFLDTVQQQQAEAEAAWRAEQQAELDAYQQAVRARAEAAEARGDEAGASAPQRASKQPRQAERQKPFTAARRPMVHIVRKKPAAAASAAAEPPAKRQRPGSGSEQGAPLQKTQADDSGSSGDSGGCGMAGLLGGYGSDSD